MKRHNFSTLILLLFQILYISFPCGIEKLEEKVQRTKVALFDSII